MPNMSLIRFADTVVANATRLPSDELQESIAVHNVNLTSDGEDDAWLDADLDKNVEHVTIIDELEFWERYGD